MVAAPSAHAAFPGTNGKIAFATNRDQPEPLHCPSCVFEIYTVNPDGSGETNITHNPADDTAPAWSPDGSKIAFSTNRDGNYEIYTMNADGSGPVRLTHDPATDYAPSWSPDGSKIVFGSTRTPGCGIYVMNAADGSSVTRVAAVRGCGDGLGAPVWSPDGAQIAFDYYDDTVPDYFGNYIIFTIKPDGTNLTAIAGGYLIRPDWSPDGFRLVVEDYFNAQPYLMTRNGGGKVAAGPNYRAQPVWSPDGQRLAFVSFDIPAYAGLDISTSNPDGTGVAAVTNDHAFARWPDWQPITNHAPACASVTDTPGTLWPPNHKLVPVSLTGATDPDGDQVTTTITGVTQDERTGHRPDAALGPASNQVSLRATRVGRGDGRVYRIAFTASDGRGGECTGTATVGVPHNKRGTAVDSAPPSYNSLGD